LGFERAAKASDVKPGALCEFQVAGRAIAVANIGGKLCAISGVCAHEGGPLGEGYFDGQVVTCPWHGWQFEVATGKLVENPTLSVETYPVEIRGDDIFIDIEQLNHLYTAT